MELFRNHLSSIVQFFKQLPISRRSIITATNQKHSLALSNLPLERTMINSITASLSSLTPHLSTLPAAQQQTVALAWSEFAKPDELDDSLLASLGKVWGCSRFVMDQCIRRPEMLIDLQRSGDLHAASVRSGYHNNLLAMNWNDDQSLMRALRHFRNREMVRIAWRDIAGWSDLDETLADLTALAECCLQVALDDLYQRACQKFGTPQLSDGQRQRPVILGMGKLGAGELNYSSDIDLIVAYPEEGTLPDRKETSYSQFFTRLIRSLVNVIDTATADGFVFRIDLRLRPFGESGPLVMSFDGMEQYYQGQAREWERYAMIKARPVAGDPISGELLQAMLRPFVYRRYLDYRALGELRSLKRQIEQELQRKDQAENIKLGPGGIREIEFIGQAFQLIRGGRDTALQQRPIQTILQILADLELLPTAVVKRLTEAYRYLRRVENRLQQYNDQQTHSLPTSHDDQERLAFSLDYPSWQAFKPQLDEIRNQVDAVFQQVFESPQPEQSTDNDAQRLWSVVNDPEQAFNAAEASGFRAPQQAVKMVETFRDTPAFHKVTTQGASLLDQLIPMLISVSSQSDEAEIVLQRILKLIEAIASRTVYLSLLVENPPILLQLVKLAGASSWIIAHLSRYPLLLDELIDTRRLFAPLTREELQQDLAHRLSALGEEDEEHQMTELRLFKQAQILRVAAADIMDAIPVTVVSDYLTDIAEVILDKITRQEWARLVKKHGLPPAVKGDQVSGFGIIAYGKMGGLELGYGSDLDLVFLFDAEQNDAATDGRRPISVMQFYTRLGQRLIHTLSTKMLDGLLYEVDMRLRPDGNSGLLVTPINAFENYQKDKAWIWEHQALVRARFVAGDPAVADKFNAIRATVLQKPRLATELCQEVITMREKMRLSLIRGNANEFDLKQGHGGITDIEFLVQYGVLLLANRDPQLTHYTDNVRLLEALSSSDFISTEEAKQLTEAYYKFRNRGHQAALQERQPVVDATEAECFKAERERVEATWSARVKGEVRNR